MLHQLLIAGHFSCLHVKSFFSSYVSGLCTFPLRASGYILRDIHRGIFFCRLKSEKVHRCTLFWWWRSSHWLECVTYSLLWNVCTLSGANLKSCAPCQILPGPHSPKDLRAFLLVKHFLRWRFSIWLTAGLTHADVAAHAWPQMLTDYSKAVMCPHYITPTAIQFRLHFIISIDKIQLLGGVLLWIWCEQTVFFF